MQIEVLSFVRGHCVGGLKQTVGGLKQTGSGDGPGVVVYPCAMSNADTLPIEPDLPAETPDAYVEAMVRRAGTSFFWGMRRLAPAKRRGVFAVYAFCRDADDIADGTASLDEKKWLLDHWRQEVLRLFEGAPVHPISRALAEPVRVYGLKKEDFLAVVDGMEMDARPRVRIADMAELELYCDRVASAVGRLCVRIFGMEDAPGIRLSASLGQALQLTNILRDIAEDAACDRVYLPADMLADAGAATDSIEDILAAPGLPALCEHLAARAEEHFNEAERIIRAQPADAVRPAVMMMQVYRAILVKLRRRGWTTLNVSVGPSKLEKLVIAVRYGLLGL